jgi:hypothetical protein
VRAYDTAVMSATGHSKRHRHHFDVMSACRCEQRNK